MAVRVQINRAQFDKLVQKVVYGTVFQAALSAAALEVKGLASVYPPVRKRPAMWSQDPEKRKKQLRGFFYKLKNGEIDAPYRRGLSRSSKKLGQSWTIANRGPLSRVIGTGVGYAPLVMGEQQAPYHQGNWKPIKQTLIENQGRIQNIMAATVRRII